MKHACKNRPNPPRPFRQDFCGHLTRATDPRCSGCRWRRTGEGVGSFFQIADRNLEAALKNTHPEIQRQVVIGMIDRLESSASSAVKQ
ncbi:MAG: hypothetical protein D6740_05625 [Alphaproteobacteria bacterium]|nr:MAG: hypothetical protein D6740_05625 [Alphaproteobacteria bacterium]